MFKIFKSSYNLLDKDDKKYFYFLLSLGICSSVLEVFGLSLIIPVVTIILNDNIYGLNPTLDIILNFFGSPNQTTILYLSLIFFILFYLFKSFFSSYLIFKLNSFLENIKVKISTLIFHTYLHRDYSFFLDTKSSVILRNIRRETELFLDIILQASLIFLIEFLVVMGILFLLFYFQPYGSLLIVLVVFLIIILHRALTKKITYVYGRKRQENETFCIETIQLAINSVIIIKLKNFENKILDKFKYFAKEEAKSQKIQATFQELPRMWLELLAITSLSIFILVTYYQNYGTTQIIYTLAVFGGATFRILPSMNRIFVSIQKLRYGNPIIQVMNELYAEYSKTNKISKKDDLMSIDKINNLSPNIIKLEGIKFKYKNNLILDNISLLIKSGENVAITGDTGSGKSSLINLMLGLLKPSEGNVFYRNVQIDKILHHYRKKTFYVPQNSFLFNDTILNNITMFERHDNINLFKIEKIIEILDLKKFIDNSSKGIYTVISENSNNISGGQKQKLSLARALYSDCDILILDEPTSAIDEKTRNTLIKNILFYMKEKNTIMVTHDLNSLQYFDTGYMLKDKKITKL